MNLRTILSAALAGLATAGFALLVASRADGLLHVTVLNTGSSPAVFVRTGSGATVLVDGGASPTLLLAALGRVLPPATGHIDLVVITGGEEAAVNGLTALPGHYSIGTVITPGNLNPGGNDVVADLANGGADVLDAGGAQWSFGGADWRCAGFVALATARSMCAVVIDDPTGRVLVLGDAGTADQEDLCAVYGSTLDANLVVTPPGGAIAPALLATAHPSELAVPVAQGAPVTPIPHGYPADRTGTDGDLTYTGGPRGLMEGG